ncbi:MAG: hypothetical protein ABI395_05135 [Sphingobium sp.]
MPAAMASDVSGRHFVDVAEVIKARSGDRVNGIYVHDVTMMHCGMMYNAWDVNTGLSNARFSHIVSTDAQRGLLKFRGPAHDIVVEDFTLQVTTINTDPQKIPEGIAFAGKTATDVGENFLIRNGRIDGLRSQHAAFLNGDGVATEMGYRNVRLENIISSNNSDAGFDLKSGSTTGANLTASGNHHNFKLWFGQNFDGPIISINPAGQGAAHILLIGAADNSSTYSFSHISFRSDTAAPLLSISPDGGRVRVVIQSYDMNVPSGTPMIFDPAKLATVEWGTQIQGVQTSG